MIHLPVSATTKNIQYWRICPKIKYLS